MPRYEDMIFYAVTDEQAVEKSDNNGLIAGLVAVGLLAMLTKHGDSDGTSTASKNVSSGSNQSQTNSGTSSASEAQQALTLLNKDRTAYGLRL